MRAIQYPDDTLQNCIRIVENCIVPKAQDPITLSFNKTSSSLVRFDLLRMLSAIEFDYQAPLHTAKVSYERSNGMLPAEFSTTQLAVTQTRPKFLLRVGSLPS